MTATSATLLMAHAVDLGLQFPGRQFEVHGI